MCLARLSHLPAMMLLAAAIVLAGCPSSTPVAPASKTGGGEATSGDTDTAATDNGVQKPEAAGPKAPVTVTTGNWEIGLDDQSRLVSVSASPEAKSDELAEVKKLDVYPTLKSGSAGDAVSTLKADAWTVTFNPAGHLIAVALGPSGSDANLEALAGVKTLERLTADKRGVTDKGLESIARLPALKVLDLTLSGITNDGLAHLKSAPKLEDINLKRCDVTADGYKHLAEIKTLKRIRAAQTNFDDKCLEAIAGMSQLEQLDLQDCNRVTESGLAALAKFPKLRNLRLWGPTITDNVLGHVKDAQELRALSLEQSAIGKDGLAHIAGLPNLTELKLYGSNNVDVDAIEQIKGMTKLTSLDLRSTSAVSRAMTHLTGLTALKELDLSETAVGDKGLAEIARLENLEDLNLWLTTATDAGMEHVGKLKKLRRLNLDKCKVGDDGLAHLKGLSELEYLHLGTTRVTDAGLPHLYELKNLQELVITFCPKVTPEGIKQLQDKLPGLTKVTR